MAKFRGGQVKASGAPDPGVYTCVFKDAEEAELSPMAIRNSWNPQFKMLFQVEGSDKIITAWGNMSAGPKTDIYPILSAMIGHDLQPNENWDLEPLIGGRYEVTVSNSRGTNKVTAVKPL